MYTIIDVAKFAGVSTATVSNVINNKGNVTKKTEMKVRQAIQELNYIPNHIAKGLKTNNSQNIGIIVEDITAFSSADIIDGICAYCESIGYSVHLTNLRINQKFATSTTLNYDVLNDSVILKETISAHINLLLSSRISGLIYIGSHPRNVSNLIPHLNIPIVFAYAYAWDTSSSVNYNDFQGAQLVLTYLLEQKHTKIGLISGPINSEPSHQRLLGYQKTLIENGIAYRPEYVKIGDWHFDDGYELCNQLLNLNDPPTAIFAMNDLMALGAVKSANNRGLDVPLDISIHGFDNLPLTEYFHPAISSVDLELKTIGSTSAKLLIEQFNNSNFKAKHIQIPCQHIPRQSTKKLSL